MKTLIILCAPCGVGKSTMKDVLVERKQLPDFVCLDTDEIGIGWHNYSGTEKENQYYTDCLARTVEISGDKNIFFVSAGMNPQNFYNLVELPKAIDRTFFIGMTCSDEEITKRLKARPSERKTEPGSKETKESFSALLITQIRRWKKLQRRLKSL